MLADDGNKFASIVTIYFSCGNPDLASDLNAAIQTPDIVVDDRKIVSLSPGTDSPTHVVLTFDDGTTCTEGFIIHRPETKLDLKFVKQLGIEVSERGDIVTSPPFCQTTVPGIYAAGDCASPAKVIPNAISMGAYARCGLARELPRRITGNSINGIA